MLPRPFDDYLARHSPALRALQLLQFALDNIPIFVELAGAPGIETEDQRGLCVGGTNQPPTFRKLDAHTVYIDNRVAPAKELFSPLHNRKFPLIGAVHTNLRGREAFRKIREQRREGTSHAGQKLQKTD